MFFSYASTMDLLRIQMSCGVASSGTTMYNSLIISIIPTQRPLLRPLFFLTILTFSMVPLHFPKTLFCCFSVFLCLWKHLISFFQQHYFPLPLMETSPSGPHTFECNKFVASRLLGVPMKNHSFSKYPRFKKVVLTL
jgi:hypothetical protein